ncbi:MAG: tripartite tricarboxylate transporter permease, partial [Chloroflexota bacterium]|nr:tripartite tricarboxylate transporter permease [Chloroflexota bacterium]
MPDILGTLGTVLQSYGRLDVQLWLVFGSILSLFFGALPGISATTVIALLIPFSWGMDPFLAFVLFGAAGGASCNLGGSIPAILINTPGTVPNWATTLDGYPLTLKGKSGLALGASAGSAVLGSFLGLTVFLLLLPVTSKFLLKFSPPEFFLLAVMGISTIAFLTRGNA